jgi:cell division protein FtsZ
LVAGLGGGTGTGAAPVVARIAKVQGFEVTAVVTWPIPSLEGRRRVQQARRGLTALQEYVARIAVVKLRELLPVPPATRIRDIYEMADHKAARAVMDTLCGRDSLHPRGTRVTGSDRDSQCSLGFRGDDTGPYR